MMMTRKMKMLFTLSVIVNVLLLGTAGGMAYKHWSQEPYSEVYADMSPEARNIVARTMQTAFRDGREEMKKAREVKKEIRAILSAETFDAEAFDAQAEKLHTIMSGMGHKRIDVTKELAEQLSQADRKVLAEKFSKGFHGRDRRGGHKGRPHEFLKEQERDAGDDIAVKKGVRPMETPELPKDMPPPPEPE